MKITRRRPSDLLLLITFTKEKHKNYFLAFLFKRLQKDLTIFSHRKIISYIIINAFFQRIKRL